MIEEAREAIRKLYTLIGNTGKKRAYVKVKNAYGKNTEIDLDSLHDMDELLLYLGFEIDESKLPADVIHPRMIVEHMRLYRTRYLPLDSSYYSVHETPHEEEKKDGDSEGKEDEKPKHGDIPEKVDADTRIRELDERIKKMQETDDGLKRLKRYMESYRLTALDCGIKLKNKLLVTYRDVDRYEKEEGSSSFFYKLSAPIALTIFYLTYRFVSEVIPDDTYKTAILVPLITAAAYYSYAKSKVAFIDEKENSLRKQEVQIFANALVKVTEELETAVPDAVIRTKISSPEFCRIDKDSKPDK